MVHGNAARDEGRGEMGISPWENRRKRLENLVPPNSRALGGQGSGNSRCRPAPQAGGDEDVGKSIAAGVAAEVPGGVGRSLGQQQRKSFFQRGETRKQITFGAGKEKPWDTFLYSRPLGAVVLKF